VLGSVLLWRERGRGEYRLAALLTLASLGDRVCFLLRFALCCTERQPRGLQLCVFFFGFEVLQASVVDKTGRVGGNQNKNTNAPKHGHVLSSHAECLSSRLTFFDLLIPLPILSTC
jgi:hypothetical protein